MAYYEHVYIARQDIAPAQVESLTQSLEQIVQERTTKFHEAAQKFVNLGFDQDYRYEPTEAELRTATRKFKESGFWLNSYGPRPDMQSTRVPKHIRQEFGL